MDLSKAIQDACVSGWPAWQNPYTIHLEENFNNAAHRIDPEAVIYQSRDAARQGLPRTHFWKQLEETLVLLIYGLNLIESAGCDFSETRGISQDIFQGNGYAARDGTQGQREVITHTQALIFLVNEIILKGNDWSEELILKTHGILHNGLDEDVAAGEYRDHEVTVSYDVPGAKKPKRSICMRSTAVPQYMKSLILNLNAKLASIESSPSRRVDPYTLAGRPSLTVSHRGQVDTQSAS